MCVQLINKEDIFILSSIGKTSLPIYYSSYHLLELFENESCIILKKIQGDNIVGFIVLKQYNDEHIHIMSIALLPTYRGKSFGSELLKYMKSNYPSKLYTLYVQSSNKKAVKFYMNNGFNIDKVLPDYYSELPEQEAYYCICEC